MTFFGILKIGPLEHCRNEFESTGSNGQTVCTSTDSYWKWPLVCLNTNISASTWPKFKIKDSFEILRTSRFQNWPYFLNLVEIWWRYCPKTNCQVFLWTQCTRDFIFLCYLILTLSLFYLFYRTTTSFLKIPIMQPWCWTWTYNRHGHAYKVKDNERWICWNNLFISLKNYEMTSFIYFKWKSKLGL